MPDLMPAIYTKTGLTGTALKAAAESAHEAAAPDAQWDLRTGWAAGQQITDPPAEVQCSVEMPSGDGWTQTAEDPAVWAVRQDSLLGDI